MLPESWYPKNTPSNFEKWQAPACQKCNRELGQIENDLLLRIGLCLDPHELRSLGVPQKALRSINPKHAKKEKDKLHRGKRRDNIIRNLIHYDDVPKESIFPNFGPTNEEQFELQPGILLKDKDLRKLTEKIVRGTIYVLNNSYIDEDYKIDVFFVHNESASEFIALINKFGEYHQLGPGITLGIAVVEENPICSIVFVEIWGRLRLYAAVETT